MEDLALANLLLEVNILSILNVYKHVNHNHLNLGIYNILSLLQSGSANQLTLSLIHISEPTRPLYISYAVFCLKKKK